MDHRLLASLALLAVLGHVTRAAVVKPDAQHNDVIKQAAPHVEKSNTGGSVSKLSLGCAPDMFDHTRLQYHIYTREHNTATQCVAICRKQHFKFAGVMNGVECYCSNDEIRGEFAERNMTSDDTEDMCQISCPGDSSEQCGDKESTALYMAPEDWRYFGCYKDISALPDLPVYQWGVTSNRTAHQCIETCASLGFLYAGVQNGGACYCGNLYGRHGEESEENCDVKCRIGHRQNCGGFQANAIYMTERSHEMTEPEPDDLITTFYDYNVHTSISMDLFNQHQRLTSIITPKLAITASDAVVNQNQTDCISSCYTTCGEIHHPEGFDLKGEDLILRLFHLNLRDLPAYVTEDTKRLFIYAQTVVLDRNLNVGYSLLIRTRELIVDQSNGPLTISVDPSVPDLDIPADEFARSLEPNLIFLKQSSMCARILLETKIQKDFAKAFEIADDIVKTKATDGEAQAFVLEIKTLMSEMAGMMRANVHYVPVYTKTHMSQVLETYSTELDIYKEEFDRILDREISDRDFLEAVDRMQKIYAETDIEEAMAQLDAALVAVARSNATYEELNNQYVQANATMESTGDVFDRALDQAIADSKKKATRSFIKLVVSAVSGIIKSIINPGSIAKNLINVGIAVVNLANALAELSKVIEKVMQMRAVINELLSRIADVHSGLDYMELADAIEEVVELYTSLVYWQNFKENANIVMNDGELKQVHGAREYHQSMLEVANWGLAMCKSGIELAEALRVAMEKRLIYDIKIKQQERVDEVLDEIREDMTQRDLMTYALMEQTYDVRLELNGALVTFCQAYFYENLYSCKDAYRPSFGGSLKDLLLKISAARKDAMLIGTVPSTVARSVRIEDESDNPDCEDMSSCPINYFRKNRMFYYIMPLDHKDLWDLDKYRVQEVEVHFEGLVIEPDEQGNTRLKLVIESTGQFLGRYQGVVYDFLSRGVTMLYEYDIERDKITIHGDVYNPYRSIVSHVTPFTTWVVRVAEDRSSNIDVSEVTAITMTLRGSAVTRDA